MLTLNVLYVTFKSRTPYIVIKENKCTIYRVHLVQGVKIMRFMQKLIRELSIDVALFIFGFGAAYMIRVFLNNFMF